MPEEIFYQDDYILVTSTRVVLSKQMYPVANITSVSVKVNPADYRGALVALLTGLTFIGCSLCAAAPAFSDKQGGNNPEWVTVMVGFFLMGVLGILITLALGLRAKATYAVRIGLGGFNERDVLVSQDRAYIQDVVNAIGDAIIQRG